MVNTAYFIKDYLEVEISRLRFASSASDIVALQHAQASVFETFLWLHLGVELRYFDANVAAYLLKTIYEPELFASLRIKNRFTVEDREYQNEPMERRYNQAFFRLAGLFPALQPLLSRCVDQYEVFKFFNLNFKEIDKFRPMFQCLYATSCMMCEDIATQNFIAAVNFCDDSEWTRLIGEKIAAEELFRDGGDSGEISVKDTTRVVPGFVRLLVYMFKFKSMSDDMRAAAEGGVLDRRDIGAVIDRMRMMQGWRTSVLSATAGERMKKLANALDIEHKDFLSSFGLKKGYFATQLSELTGAWFLQLSAGI